MRAIRAAVVWATIPALVLGTTTRAASAPEINDIFGRDITRTGIVLADWDGYMGAFGNEYYGDVPLGRWLITRTDLLAARAVGYKLRNAAAAFVPLSIAADSLPAASTARAYKASLQAQGGIPFYDWQVSKGKLPDGLSLNRFTGEVSGKAHKVGKFDFTVLLYDYQKKGEGVSRELTIEVRREAP